MGETQEPRGYARRSAGLQGGGVRAGGITRLLYWYVIYDVIDNQPRFEA